jgi:hypothetical protein
MIPRSARFTALFTVVGVIAVAMGVWALILRSEVADLRDDNRAMTSEIELLRQQANATSYRLAPTADAPVGASGMAFFNLDGTGVIAVTNLDRAPEGRSYQVWYFPEPDAEALPGATFAVDDSGTGFMLIPADVGLFTDVIVTLEPAAGSTTPTGPIVLSGATGGARG